METIPVPKEDLDSLYIDSVMLIDHLEKTIKDASIFLIDKSDKKQLTYSEMKELYELLVDAIGFNDGQYFAD